MNQAGTKGVMERISGMTQLCLGQVLSALTLAVVFLACNGSSTLELPDSPHPIIIIDIDTLRADRLGCYGHDRDTSPNIDQLVQESVLFEWAFSQAPNTPPSQTSILTGLYPSTHGMIVDEDRIPQEVTTLAEALAQQGFVTAGFHDGGYMSHTFGMDQGFGVYEGYGSKGVEVIGPKAIDWVRNHADENFFLLIHTYDVHTPYSPPPPYRDFFLQGLAPPTPGFEPTSEEMENVRLSKYTETPRKLSEVDLEYAKALYDGGIRYVDEWIGRFLAELETLGLDQRATIVIISDHGEEFQEHGSVLHEKLYATVTRVPLILRLPGGKLSKRIPQIVETVDLVPTLLDLVGAPHHSGLQGRSLVPLMLGDESWRERAFSESPYFGERRAVTLASSRLLMTLKDNTIEVYEFRQDPLEQNDISEGNEQRNTYLIQQLEAWQELVEGAAYERTHDGRAIDEETREQLEALGYLGDGRN